MKNTSLLLLGIIFSIGATAGTRDSGGGPGIVCISSSGEITSAKNYDLYEGEVLFGMKPLLSDSPIEIQLSDFVTKLKKYNYFIGSSFADNLEYIRAHYSFLPDGVVMNSGVSDLGPNNPPISPVSCQIQYIGYYKPDGTLMISKTVFDKMSSTDQAALFAHEALYRMTRSFSKATDSEKARKLNSVIWSGSDFSLLDSIADAFTWNNSQFLGVQRLQRPIVLQSSEIDMSIASSINSCFTYEVNCKDQDLNTVSSITSGSGNFRKSQINLDKKCKLYEVILQLHPTTSNNCGSLDIIDLKLFSNNSIIFHDWSQKPEGLARIEFEIPIYY